MSDVSLLICILSIFYLHDCSLWHDRDTIAFVAHRLSRWRPKRPHPLLSGSTKGLLLSFRLPPLAAVYLCYPWRASLSPTHVCPTPHPASAEDAATQQTRQALAYTAAASVGVLDHTIRVNGKPFVSCQGPHQATALAQLLRTLAGLSQADRRNAIYAALAGTMDLKAIRRDVAMFAGTGVRLRVLCNTLFLYLFLAVPILLTLYGLSFLWPILVTTLATLVLVIAVAYRNIHVGLWPQEKSSRRSTLARICCYPPTAIRAYDYLAHRLCAHYFPLSVALVLCERPVFDRFARPFLRQLHYPLADGTADPAAIATEAWFRTAQMECIRHSLAAGGIDLDAYLQAPPRLEAGSLTFCPRCETEYAVTSGTCADCPGVALIPYPPAADPLVATARSAAHVSP